MLRDLKKWTQKELSKRSGMNICSISGLENERIKIGRTRALKPAKAFDVHPSIIMFPEYGPKGINEVYKIFREPGAKAVNQPG